MGVILKKNSSLDNEFTGSVEKMQKLKLRQKMGESSR